MTAPKSLDWRIIPGFDYWVSEDGKIKNKYGKMVKDRDYYGYRRVGLWHKNKRLNMSVHRAVLLAFVGPAPKGYHGAHLDGNRSNNILSNLQWGIEKKKPLATHKQSHTSLYMRWANMLGRCSNINNRSYKYYGARGITVCDRWLDFSLFIADMGRPPNGYSLDRIDNDKGYCKENCRWVSCTTNMRNTRRNKMITHEGQTLCLSQWGEKTGIHPATINSRLKRGLTIAEALSEPVQQTGRGRQ